MKYDYDLIIIGVGSAGISSANIAVSLGKKVAVIEKNKIGGECTWTGCVPSKALLKSGQIANAMNRLEDYGLEANCPVRLKTGGVLERVRRIRKQIYEKGTPESFREKGIDVFHGDPVFKDRHEIVINDRNLTSKRFIISTGSRPFVPPVNGLDDVSYLTNTTFFELEQLPSSMLILGGGPIGAEMACALNRLNVNITLVEMAGQILPREDSELAEIVSGQLKKEGVTIRTNTKLTQVRQHGRNIKAVLESNPRQSETVESESLLIAAGRTPNIDSLGLEKAGVAWTKKGIKTNTALQTSARHIYACGDVTGDYQFSHVAEYHAEIAVVNAVLPLPFKRKFDDRRILWATFTDPELARAGMTESDAREKYGERIKIYRYRYQQVDRAKTDGNETGLSKFVCDSRNRLLGIHIAGERASELLHEVQLSRRLGASFGKIRSMVHIYPTYGDMVKWPSNEAFLDTLLNNFFVRNIRKLTS